MSVIIVIVTIVIGGATAPKIILPYVNLRNMFAARPPPPDVTCLSQDSTISK